MGPKNRPKKLKPGTAANQARGRTPLAPRPAAFSTRVPADVQQTLDVFRRAFPLAQQDGLPSAVQTVKGHLYDRDFASAFAHPSHRDAYALRWSAGRALAYSDIFATIHLRHAVFVAQPDAPDAPPAPTPLNVVCVGGGAGAEVVALAAMITHLSLKQPLSIHAVDIADWKSCLTALHSSVSHLPLAAAPAPFPPAHPLVTNPTTTPNAGGLDAASTSLSHDPSFPQLFHLQFTQADILAQTEAQLSALVADARLVTIMFTLNELFSAADRGLARTTGLLLALGDAMRPGSWLLVVDSPGSYSEVALGSGRAGPDDVTNVTHANDGPGTAGEQQQQAQPQPQHGTLSAKEPQQTTKRYPMQWLLDHTLLTVAATSAGMEPGGSGSGGGERTTGHKRNSNTGKKWRKVISDDSRWFRLPHAGLTYPIALENMRYQIHLFQRVGTDEEE